MLDLHLYNIINYSVARHFVSALDIYESFICRTVFSLSVKEKHKKPKAHLNTSVGNKDTTGMI